MYVCCVTTSGSLGCFQPTRVLPLNSVPCYDTFLLSIIPKKQHSYRLGGGPRHVPERVCLCVLVAYSLAKSPPQQVGQLHNGSWNRHGNNHSGQASEGHTNRRSQTLSLIIRTPPRCLSETLSSQWIRLRIHHSCSFTLFCWTMSRTASGQI